MLPESERKRAQSPKKKAEEKRKQLLQSSFIRSLTMGLKTESEIFKLTSQQIVAFPTVLKVWQSAHYQYVHILAYSLDHYQHLCVLMNSK